MRWAVLSAELQESQNLRESFDRQLVSNALLANRYVARNDARNYIVIGDPAVQLRHRRDGAVSRTRQSQPDRAAAGTSERSPRW